MTFLTDLDAPFTEHGHCSDLEAGGDGDMAWIACDCRATMARRVDGAGRT